jgi:putative ABC transport system permease protein
MKPFLPIWPTKLISWWCDIDYREEVLGDLEEEFYQSVEVNGVKSAKRQYWWTVLKSLRPYLRKSSHQIQNYNNPNPIDMFKNYFKIAIRSMVKQKLYAGINVMGLGIGLACCLLIGLFVNHELSYDNFHENADNTYRVGVDYSYNGTSGKMAMTPTALLPSIQREFESVENGVRVFSIGMFSPVAIQNGEDQYQEEGFLYVDSTFFDVLTFPLISGDPAKALTEPNSLVLSESTAQKYFGSLDVIGKSLSVNNKEFLVTGVAKDVPDNSHLTFDILASFSSLLSAKKEIWRNANYTTYVRLNDSADMTQLSKGMDDNIREVMGEEFFAGGNEFSYYFKPIKEIHLRSEIEAELEPQSSIKYVYIFSLIGLMILTIACVNYMNLATARSVDRGREVGMRKVLGAVRKQLFYQFIGESFVITISAILISILLVNFLLSPFNLLTGKVLNMGAVFTPMFLLAILVIMLVVGFLAGAYPALVLSGFKPAQVLKGSFKMAGSGAWIRKGLVVFQFGISIFLIIGTIVIYKQLNFMSDKKLGYTKENVLVLPMDKKMSADFEIIKGELLRDQEVINVSAGSDSPVEVVGGYSIRVNGLNEENSLSINAVIVDRDFVNTLEMELIAGTDFTDSDFELSTLENEDDRQHAFIVNEELLEQLFISTDEAVGMKAEINGRKGEIRGVVKNFHFAPLHRKINALAMFIEPEQYNLMLIKLNSTGISQTLDRLEGTWKELVPHRPFEYEFLDQEYDRLYQAEQRLGKIFTVFATLAIVIACLGLFGLVSFTAIQRAKEIGVRKVLGASVSGLVVMISSDFAKLVLVSFVIAAPLGYYAMNSWLLAFEYRVNVGMFPILASVIIAVLIAFITISFQAIKSALLNPAEVLRSGE